jgi:hypothetical protein
MNAVLVDPKSQARLADLGVAPMPLTKKFISDETEKWAKVIKSAGVSAAHLKPFRRVNSAAIVHKDQRC